jgi:hypothetical protein
MRNTFNFAVATAILLILGIPQSGISQFKDANVVPYSYSLSPIMSENTGNDVLDYGGQTYEVMVCDDPNGNNALFGWRVGSNIGYIPIGPGVVKDPDVCLVKNGSNLIYAIVAFYDSNVGQFMYQVYFWMNSQQIFNQFAPVTISSGNYHRAINIDSDDQGNFAIVWDEPGNNISMVIGSSTGAQPPQLNLSGAVIPLQPGSEPDVACFRQQATGFRQVDVAYKNTSGYIIVDFYKYNDLIGGNFVPTEGFRSPLADLVYRYPRIACPLTATGQPEDFTVVVEDSDGSSTWYIKAFNSNKCCTPTFVTTLYNDGSTGYSPYNLTLVPNTRPVVTYDNVDNTIWVAWNIDNSWGLLTAPGAPFGRYPVALAGDKRGEVTLGANYLLIPYGIGFNASLLNVSMSGAKSSKVMFTYNDMDVMEMFSKSSNHLSSIYSLRSGNVSGIQAWINQVLIGEKYASESDVQIQIMDISGKLIYKGGSTIGDLMDKIQTIKSTLNPGIYLVDLNTNASSVSYQGKLITTETR